MIQGGVCPQASRVVYSPGQNEAVADSSSRDSAVVKAEPGSPGRLCPQPMGGLLPQAERGSRRLGLEGTKVFFKKGKGNEETVFMF